MKKLVFSSFIALVFILTALPLQRLQAQDSAKDGNKVEITGIVDRQDIVGGDTVFIALTHKIQHGWHIYWRNPGDSGSAPTIDWNVPEGSMLGKLLWPVPDKIPYGPLTNYGYEKEVTLLQTVTLPDPLPETPFDIGATVDLLVCQEICIPEYHEVTVTVTGEPRPDEEAVDVFGFVSAALDQMPTDVTWRADYQEYKEEDTTYLAIDLEFRYPSLVTRGDENVKFEVFPHEWGIVDNSSPTRIKLSDDKKTLRLFRVRGERPLDKLDNLTFLVAYRVDDGRYGALSIDVKPDPQWKEEALAAAVDMDDESRAVNADRAVKVTDLPVASHIPETGLPKALIFAFLGGIILNLMPCVFPVLSLKALHLVKMSEDKQDAARMNGIAYAAGILLSFLILAAILIVLKGAGSGIGWGFHLQNPVVVSVLAAVLFVFGMNLSGFFEVKGNFAGVGSKLAEKEGAQGSFFTGILAAVVATPCTAPFMGVAIGYALLQAAPVAVLVFLMLGLGLAAPYLLLSFFPPLRRFMPKPGAWMQRFKEFLAFPLYASAAWLLWVLSQQVSALALLYALMLLVGLGMLVWVMRVTSKTALRLMAVLVVVFLGGLTFSEGVKGTPQVKAAAQNADEINGGADIFAYSLEGLLTALETDRPVFVNMTASWCTICKVNERVALDKESIRRLFVEQNIIYVKGDWTNKNAEIAEYLARYGRNGVPLYVYYGAPDEKTGKRPDPVVLPQVLTPEIIKKNVI